MAGALYGKLEGLAQAALKYAFAALLALLSAQAVMPPLRLAAGIEFVCSTKSEQREIRQVRRDRRAVPLAQPAPVHESPVRPEPDAAELFGRPPPAFLFFA